jgi:hypothetical protein
MWDDDHAVPLATQAEAEAGTVTNKLMTPQRTAQAIAALAGAGSTAWGDITGKPAAIANTTAAFTTAQETKLAGIATGATANSSDATLLDRANHTGAQAIGTVTGLQTALDGKQATVLKGEVTVTPTTVGGVLEHAETVTATGVTASSVVMLTLAPGTDADENDPELLDVLAYAALPLTNQIEITASFATRTSGPIKFNWSAF